MQSSIYNVRSYKTKIRGKKIIQEALLIKELKNFAILIKPSIKSKQDLPNLLAALGDFSGNQ